LPPGKRGPLVQLASSGHSVERQHVNREHLGVLAEKLTRERAEKLVDALQSVRVDAEVCAMEQLVANPRPKLVRKAGCLERGFVEHDLYGRERLLVWQSLMLLSAAMVRIKREVHRHDSNGAHAAGVEKRTIPKIVTRWVLDIFTQGKGSHGQMSRSHSSPSHAIHGDTEHFRIVQDEFNYQGLGVELSVTDSWHNLRLFAHQLEKYATDAARTDGFVALQRGATMHVYPSLKTLDEENRWWLQRLSRA
jgi:hypothetical protein